MSNEALQYVAENLAQLRRFTYLDNGKEKALGENGLALLVFLADASHIDLHTFFMTQRTMAEEIGCGVRAVQKLLAGFIEVGWITATGEIIRYMGRGTPTPEYELTLVPWKISTPPTHAPQGVRKGDTDSPQTAKNAQNRRPYAPTYAPQGVSNLVKPLQTKEAQAVLPAITLTITPTQPTQSLSTGSKSEHTDLVGQGKYQLVLAGCVEYERAHFTGTEKKPGALAPHWGKKYADTVGHLVRLNPTTSTSELIQQALQSHGVTMPGVKPTSTDLGGYDGDLINLMRLKKPQTDIQDYLADKPERYLVGLWALVPDDYEQRRLEQAPTTKTDTRHTPAPLPASDTQREAEQAVKDFTKKRRLAG